MTETRTIPRYDDMFSRIITDDERDILMGKNVQYPMILKTLSIALSKISDKQLIHQIIQNIVTFANKRDHILPLSLKFQQTINEAKQIEIVDMLNGSDADYLSIYCGIIEGFHQFASTGDPKVTQDFIDSLGQIATKELTSSPSKNDGLNAIDVIRKTIAVNAKLSPPQKLGSSGSGLVAGWVKVT